MTPAQPASFDERIPGRKKKKRRILEPIYPYPFLRRLWNDKIRLYGISCRIRSHRPAIGERALGGQSVGKAPRSAKLEAVPWIEDQGSGMNTRSLERAHCRPVSWATKDGYRSGEKRRRKRPGRQLDTFALAVVRNVGRTGAADTLWPGARFSDQRRDREQSGRVELIGDQGRAMPDGGLPVQLNRKQISRQDSPWNQTQRTGRGQRCRHATPLRLLRFCTSHGWPRIRGSGGSLHRKMRRRPGQLRLAVHASGEHLQIGALLGGTGGATEGGQPSGTGPVAVVAVVAVKPFVTPSAASSTPSHFTNCHPILLSHLAAAMAHGPIDLSTHDQLRSLLSGFIQ